MEQKQETHPWKWYVPNGARTLMVGTFPPTKRNWNYDFFYPNKNNFFWRIIASIANKPLQHFSGNEAVEERKALLDFLRLGITDMGYVIDRLQDSSLDENIAAVEFMDIQQILKENPSINKIIFTSSSGKSSAATWFKNYLFQKGTKIIYPKGSKPQRLKWLLNNKEIELVIVHSPSPRAACSIGFERLEAMYRQEII